MELKGKQLSLGAKIAAVIFVLLCFVVMLFSQIEMPMTDVISVGIFIALVFSPVDISLWIENFMGKKYHRKTIPSDGKDDD